MAASCLFQADRHGFRRYGGLGPTGQPMGLSGHHMSLVIMARTTARGFKAAILMAQVPLAGLFRRLKLLACMYLYRHLAHGPREHSSVMR